MAPGCIWYLVWYHGTYPDTSCDVSDISCDISECIVIYRDTIPPESWYFVKNWKTSAVSTTDGWLKLNFASCVIRQTRSLGVLVLCSNWNMVFVNYIYDVVVDTKFHKFYGRPFARVLYLFLMKDIGRWLPGCYQGQQDDFRRMMLSITILRTDTI